MPRPSPMSTDTPTAKICAGEVPEAIPPRITVRVLTTPSRPP